MAADHGVVSCLSAKTGELKWMERVAGSCSGSLLFAGGRIYLTDEEGKTFVFNARSQYRLVAENDLQGENLGQPNCRSKRTGYQNRGPSLENQARVKAIRRISGGNSLV